MAVRNRHCASRLPHEWAFKVPVPPTDDVHSGFGAMTLSGSDIYLTRRTWFLMTATGVREHRWVQRTGNDGSS